MPYVVQALEALGDGAYEGPLPNPSRGYKLTLYYIDPICWSWFGLKIHMKCYGVVISMVFIFMCIIHIYTIPRLLLIFTFYNEGSLTACSL